MYMVSMMTFIFISEGVWTPYPNPILDTLSWKSWLTLYSCSLFYRKQQNESAEEEQELSEVFMKTLNYCQRFSRFKNRETIGAVRRYVFQYSVFRIVLAGRASGRNFDTQILKSQSSEHPNFPVINFLKRQFQTHIWNFSTSIQFF